MCVCVCTMESSYIRGNTIWMKQIMFNLIDYIEDKDGILDYYLSSAHQIIEGEIVRACLPVCVRFVGLVLKCRHQCC